MVTLNCTICVRLQQNKKKTGVCCLKVLSVECCARKLEVHTVLPYCNDVDCKTPRDKSTVMSRTNTFPTPNAFLVGLPVTLESISNTYLSYAIGKRKKDSPGHFLLELLHPKVAQIVYQLRYWPFSYCVPRKCCLYCMSSTQLTRSAALVALK